MALFISLLFINLDISKTLSYQDFAMHKWILKDDSQVCLCESCSKKDYKKLIIRTPWKANEKHAIVNCEKCGKRGEVVF